MLHLFLKKGDKQNVENYRPISLLAVVSKIMERCVHDILYRKVKDQIYGLQHGFSKGRSCTSQLLKAYHNIGANLDKGGQVDIAYLYFSKAFDCVLHNLLINKLKTSHNINGNLLRWLRNYLSNRQQRVAMESVNSDWKPVVSGVPQCSILGPLLFLLYINDMPPATSFCCTALFADDAKYFREISSNTDCTLLQKDLDCLYKLSAIWGMCFNANNCKILSIPRLRNNIHHNYFINGNILEHVGAFKDSGIVIDNKLCWRMHILSIIDKSKKVSNMVKRTVGYKAPVAVKLQLSMS